MKRAIPRRGAIAATVIGLMATVIGLGPAASGAATASASAPSAIRPVVGCGRLPSTLNIPGARTHLVSTVEVGASGTQPAYCDVHATVEPAVNFELKLPIATYTGSYVQEGCQGYCGAVFSPDIPQCGGPNGGDMAVAATDDGHAAAAPNPFFGLFDASWAANNQGARDDFLYRAPHVVSLAAKQYIADYYGHRPLHSYFNGCSTGGREGLLLAQRYPRDFDGIVVGSSAALMDPLFGVYFAWAARANIAPDGSPILTSAKLPPLHAAAMAACDGLDGVLDAQIEDPRACHFDPAILGCPAGIDQPTCLTPAQVTAARKLYAGPSDEHGRRLYPGGEPYGSELVWDTYLNPLPVINESAAAELGDNYLKYLAYPIGTPGSSVANAQFTKQFLDSLTPDGVPGNAMSLDLSAFRRAGGKLIIWHGWADQSIPPTGSVDYYQRLAAANGGIRETGQWARLFMVPAEYHCAMGGYTLNEFNPLPALIDWVEHGTAPSRILADQRDTQGTIVRTHPVFPYPAVARYTGSGSIDDAANFVAAPPLVQPRMTHWAGEYLYNLPGPTAH